MVENGKNGQKRSLKVAQSSKKWQFVWKMAEKDAKLLSKLAKK